MTRESRYGFVGLKWEKLRTGPPQTRAHGQMEAEAEAEVALSGLEAAVTRIDDSDDEPSWPTWRDQASACEDMGRRSDIRNVWARVGDFDHSAVDPTLLDSLAEDLVFRPPTNLGDIGRRGSDAIDDCSSVSSKSCWGEMEGVGDVPVAWGVLPDPPSCQADVSHHEGNRQLVSSQTVAPLLTSNRFADHVDVPRLSKSGSLFAGGADVVQISSPRVQSSSEVRRTEHENEAMGTPVDDPASNSSVWGRGAVAVRNQILARWRRRFPLMT